MSEILQMTFVFLGAQLAWLKSCKNQLHMSAISHMDAFLQASQKWEFCHIGESTTLQLTIYVAIHTQNYLN